MYRLIALLTCQLFILESATSQDHIKELARNTWVAYVKVKRQKDELEKEMRANFLVMKKMKENEDKNALQIRILRNSQDQFREKLRIKQVEYENKCKEVRILKETIEQQNSIERELKSLLDSFSVALNEQEIYIRQLEREKKGLEEFLYFKVRDLDIAEIENSYFSNFDIGCKKRRGGPIYSETSEGIRVKACGRNPLEYIRATGTAYTPINIDTLDGRVLVYQDDVLWAYMGGRFPASTKTKSYNRFDISFADKQLNNKISPKSKLEIAFVTEESFNRHKEKLKNFNNAYYSHPALFVISSRRPEVNLFPIDTPEFIRPDFTLNQTPRKIDSCTTNAQEIVISLSTNDEKYRGEFVSLFIGDSLVKENIKLYPYMQNSFSLKHKLDNGLNVFKFRAMTTSNIKGLNTCNLYVLISTNNLETIYFRKLIRLEKDELFGLFIRYNRKTY